MTTDAESIVELVRERLLTKCADEKVEMDELLNESDATYNSGINDCLRAIRTADLSDLKPKDSDHLANPLAESCAPSLTGWIPVEEGLPPQGVRVLVWPEVSDEIKTAWVSGKTWFYDANIPMFGTVPVCIGGRTHWMQKPGGPPLLPSPPDAKEQA